jgi:hypothetical protein
MRQSLYGVLLACCLSFLGISAASAAQAGGGIPSLAGVQTLLEQVQYGGYCSRLRYRCENKDELGEEGEGNCRRYRQECGGQRRSYCENLRYRCENKDELGESGEGNCRRYRQECGGRRYD